MNRRRQWIAALVTLALTFALSGVWALWVVRRTGEYPQDRLAPGTAWHQADGSTVRLASWQEETVLVDSAGKRHPSAPGAHWVLVKLQFTGVGEETLCQFDLVGDGGLRWKTSPDAPYLADGTTYCRDKEAGPDPLVTAIFQIPDSQLGKVVGVGFSHSRMLVQPPWLVKP